MEKNTVDREFQASPEILESEWNEENLRNFILSTVEKLRGLTHGRMYVDPHDIKVHFQGKRFADCAPRHGVIIFGERVFLNSFQAGTFGYPKERMYIERNCWERADRLRWLVCHEWCHLYKGKWRHTEKFFRFVEETYRKII